MIYCFKPLNESFLCTEFCQILQMWQNHGKWCLSPSSHTQPLGHLKTGWAGRGRAEPVSRQLKWYCTKGCCRSFISCLATQSSATAFFLMKVFHNSLCDYLNWIPRCLSDRTLNYQLLPPDYVQFCIKTTLYNSAGSLFTFHFLW